MRIAKFEADPIANYFGEVNMFFRKPKIAIRTDASHKIGLGHIRRCMNLAEALKLYDAEIEFFIHGDQTAGRLLRSAGYSHSWINEPDGIPNSAFLASTDALIVDSYSFRTSHYHHCNNMVPIVAAIDDMAQHTLPVDIVINQNLSAASMNYSVRSDTQCLFGAEYALLNPEFAQLRNRENPDQLRVLVMMGGTDLHGQTERVIKAISGLPATFYVDIIIGPSSDSLHDVKRASDSLSMLAYVHIDPPDLASIMARATVAISTGGVTALELACLGIPTIVLTVADNQTAPAQALNEHGAVLNMGPYDQIRSDELNMIIRGLLVDPASRTKMAGAGRGLVDGLGAQRAAEAIMGKISGKTGLSWMRGTPQPFRFEQKVNLATI